MGVNSGLAFTLVCLERRIGRSLIERLWSRLLIRCKRFLCLVRVVGHGL